MTALTAAIQRGHANSLPPLGGRLFDLYRLVWLALAVAAAAIGAALPFDGGMEPAILALRLVKAVVLIAVSTILFRRRRHDPVAAMLSLAFLLWTVTSSFDLAQADLRWPALLDRLRFLLFALALLLFPNGSWSPRWTRQVALASAAVFALGVGEALMLVQTRLFLPLAIACVLAAIGALLQRYRSLGEGIEKQQLKWVAFGVAAGVGLILAARAGDAWNGLDGPAAIPVVLVEACFQLGIVVLALGFLVPLLRYRLYDAEAVISRSAALAVLTVTLVAIFAASETLIEMLGQRYFGAGIGDISGAVAAAVAAVLLAPLNQRISDWAELRFQRDLATLRRDLPELLAELAAASSAARVGAAALPRICAAVQATRGALLVDGTVVASANTPKREARCRAHDDFLFPTRLALRCPFGGERGWLVLGPRPDGSAHGRDDRDALAAIVPPLRQALFAARERERELARDRRDKRNSARAIRQLMARLSALEAAAPAPGKQKRRRLATPPPDIPKGTE